MIFLNMYIMYSFVCSGVCGCVEGFVCISVCVSVCVCACVPMHMCVCVHVCKTKVSLDVMPVYCVFETGSLAGLECTHFIKLVRQQAEFYRSAGVSTSVGILIFF